MIKEFGFYNDIVILEESENKITYVGSPLLEDDEVSDQEKQGLFVLLKEKILGLFGKNKGDVAKVTQKMEQTDGKKLKKPMDFLKWFGTKIIGLLKFLWNSIIKAFRIMWNWIKTHIPGVNTLVSKIAKLLGKNVDQDKETVVGGEKLTFKELVAVGATSVVLIGVSGYIIKKLTVGVSSKEESTMIIDTKPLALVESDGSIKESFLKKAPTLFGRLIDFIKNVKDAAVKFIVTVLGIMIGVGIFIILALISKPAVCKAITYALLVDTAGISNQISGVAKVKYLSAKVILAMANTLASHGHTIIYDTCDCIKYDGKEKRYVYNPSGNCESPEVFRKKILSGSSSEG